jgi:AcrR family transcriptional regulator
MTQPPTGLTRRRRRLSDAETEQRMLRAGAAMVAETGLTVSIEHLSLEDVIQQAKVSRSTVYRRWPYKDLFFSDLLRELAKGAMPAAIAGEATALPGIKRLLLEHLDWLARPDRRQDLLLELIRFGGRHDFETMLGSVEWHTYLALHATFLSVVDENLRTDLRAALLASERTFIGRIASSWERLSSLLGYRLRPGSGATFEGIANMLSADLRGHVLMALTGPDPGSLTIEAQPPGALESAAWSLPALAAVSIATTFFEPDPSVVWDAARMARVRQAVTGLDVDDAAERSSTLA